VNQAQLILDALQRGEKLTALEALEAFNCLRLAARIRDLRDDGHPIATEIVHSDGKTFARYSLETAA
jgi:hypothetical protein